ncbi:MAG: hypothetical protein ACQGTM_09665 [bacterium]
MTAAGRFAPLHYKANPIDYQHSPSMQINCMKGELIYYINFFIEEMMAKDKIGKTVIMLLILTLAVSSFS